MTEEEERIPGCTIAWTVVEIWEGPSTGFYYELACETSCTVYRDDIAITNVPSTRNNTITYYTDYDVLPGSTHSYRISACGRITANAYTKTCKFIYSAEIGSNDILLDGNGGTATVPVEVRKVYAGSSSIDSWDYNYSGDWLSVEKVDNGSRIAISAGENDTGTTRECMVTISKGGYNWPIKVTQAGGAATTSYSSWAAANGLSGAWDEKDANGIHNVFRYVFNKPADDFSETPLIGVTFVDGKPVVKTPVAVNTSGLTLSVVASDTVDGTGNVTNYTLNASGETSIDEEVKPSRFFRLKAVLAQ